MSSEMFAGAKSVLFVHAHPDDETISTGGTIAYLLSESVTVSILTLTRGEQGEVREEARDSVASAGSLASARELELSCALKELGEPHHEFLGSGSARADGLPDVIYEDSGMEWGPEGLAVPAKNTGPRAITKQPVVDLLNDVMAFAISCGVQAIVSYDEIGGYGHPDHILAYRLARSVAHALEVDYWAVELSDERAGAVALNIATRKKQKMSALECYRTQLRVKNLDSIEHVGGQDQGIANDEYFVLMNNQEMTQ